MQCARCQHENRPQARFCEECAAPLSPTTRSSPDLKPEIEDLRRVLREALERETATSSILRAIAMSPTDPAPVFDAILESALRLCKAPTGGVCLSDGQAVSLAALRAPADSVEMVRATFPRRLEDVSIVVRAIREGRIVHVADVLQASSSHHAVDDVIGQRAELAVPMWLEGRCIGAISMTRPEPGLFSESQVALIRTLADQAAIAVENVRLFNETKEALEQQTATSEILQVIASSPTDLQPVLDAVAESAARLCEAFDATIFRRDGDRLRLVAHHGPIPAGTIGEFSLTLVRGTVGGRSVLEGRTVHVADMQTESDEFPEGSENARRYGHRTILSVPLMREGVAIGVIQIRRTESQLFTERQVALLQTFAAQAVIAIENVRLFRELEARNRELTEALEQQTATSDILRVISSSPTDVQPVFDTIVASAVRLCSGLFGAIYRMEGDLVDLAGSYNIPDELVKRIRAMLPVRPDRGMLAMRALLDGTVVQSPDLETDPQFRLHDISRSLGMRSLVGVPMLRDGVAIGAIAIGRSMVGSFPASQIELLKTFADQAVIAIENVRLFTELESRNRDLTAAHAQVTESLEQQTATAEILRVISSSPTDVQPVFDAIARSAMRLCDGTHGNVARFDGELLHQVAVHNFTPEALEVSRSRYGQPPSRRLAGGRAILDRAVCHIVDVESEPEYDTSLARAIGYRSVLAVPMLREGTPIGAIAVGRAARGPFSAKQVELLQTFADQAVIAIENVRLFQELRARTAELMHSVEQLTALGEVGRAVSSTLDLETVLQTIVMRANRLAGTAGCNIWEYDEPHAEFRLRASHYADERDAAALPAPGGITTIPKGQGLTTRVMELRQPVQIPDIAVEDTYESPVRHALIDAGHRALLGVPLMSED
jgi:two-component system, NtrC family, sensor kinase